MNGLIDFEYIGNLEEKNASLSNASRADHRKLGICSSLDGFWMIPVRNFGFLGQS